MVNSLETLNQINMLKAKIKIQKIALKGRSGWICHNLKKELLELNSALYYKNKEFKTNK